MLAAEHLSIELGSRRVLRDATFTLNAGECAVLFGANGAGKSTLLQILATLWKPTGGRIFWNGTDVRGARSDYRRRLGFVGHESLLYEDWSARQNLRFFAKLHAVPDAERRIAESLDEVGLTQFADNPVGIYSRGMKQRVALARALLHRPEILLLDEPFTGLDLPTQRDLSARLLAERERGASILLVTHDLELGHQVATSVLFLTGGVVENAGWMPFQELRTRYASLLEPTENRQLPSAGH